MESHVGASRGTIRGFYLTGADLEVVFPSHVVFVSQPLLHSAKLLIPPRCNYLCRPPRVPQHPQDARREDIDVTILVRCSKMLGKSLLYLFSLWTLTHIGCISSLKLPFLIFPTPQMILPGW